VVLTLEEVPRELVVRETVMDLELK
jgi:hypothetical protein